MHYSFLTGEHAVRVSGWVSARIPGCEAGWDNCVVLICHTDDEIRGGVVFHDYQPGAGVICLSAAGEPGWLTRRMVVETHEYAFQHCQMALWQVNERNEKMNAVAKRLGYTPHRIPRLAGRDKAAILWTLTDDDWNQSRFNRR